MRKDSRKALSWPLRIILLMRESSQDLELIKKVAYEGVVYKILETGTSQFFRIEEPVAWNYL